MKSILGGRWIVTWVEIHAEDERNSVSEMYKNHNSTWNQDMMFEREEKEYGKKDWECNRLEEQVVQNLWRKKAVFFSGKC